MSFLEGMFLQVFKTHPVVLLLMVIMCGTIVGYSYRVFAENSDLSALRSQHNTEFTLLNRKIDSGFTQISIKATEAQVFTLEKLQRDDEGFTDRDERRLAELVSELQMLNRKLNEVQGGDPYL